MNLTSSKTFRICVCWALILVACIGMMFIPKHVSGPSLSDADQVCVSGALYESWMYIITDKAFLDESIEILDNLEYEESDKAVNMMNAHEVLQFTYSKGNEQLKKFIVDKNGMLSFEAGGQSYKITSDFDFAALDKLVQKYIEKIKNDIAVAPKE